MKWLVVCGLWLAVGGQLATAQTDSTAAADSVLGRGDYHIELMLIGGVGATLYKEPPSVVNDQTTFRGWNVNARLMWHPDHLLGMGLMSGYQVFSRETVEAGSIPDVNEDVTLELSSIPIHVAFEMRPLHIRFGAGIGVYILMSDLIESSGKTQSSDLAYGGSAWLGYEFDITDHLHIGPDLVLQVLSDRGISNLSAMLVLRYDVLSY